MENKEIKKILEELHRGKMKSLISTLLNEGISTLIEKEINDIEILENLNKELISAVKIIFKEDLELRERDSEGKHYFGFYLDNELIFECGYNEVDENHKTRHKILN